MTSQKHYNDSKPNAILRRNYIGYHPPKSAVMMLLGLSFALSFWSFRVLNPSTHIETAVERIDPKIDLWCGKPYKLGSPRVPVGGQFPSQMPDEKRLHEFRCVSGMKPYVAGEDTRGSVIIDSAIPDDPIDGAPSSPGSGSRTLYVTITTLNYFHSFSSVTFVANGTVPLNSTAAELPFRLDEIFVPRLEPYQIFCSALDSQTGRTYMDKSDLLYLPPNPYGGSTVKLDRLTGGLMVKDRTGEIPYTPFFPFGFYTSYGGHVQGHLDRLDQIKADGYNLVHLVPPFEGVETALDRMEQLGLWFIYDTRWSFKNMTSLREQATMIRSRPNLLLWYTADEPDGWVEPLEAPKLAAEELKALDPYHPISLSLNCQDYFYKEYTEGADIVLQDVYPIEINASFSAVYNTPCTLDYGDCGCDNCVGGDIGLDIARRATDYRSRAQRLGKGRTMTVWSVPQAFGNETFWPRKPTGQEFVVMTLVAIIHGSLGITPWLYPTTEEINTSASSLASVIPLLAPLLLHPATTRTLFTAINDTLHFAHWTSPEGTLLIIANAGTSQVERTFDHMDLPTNTGRLLFSSGKGNHVQVEAGHLDLVIGGLAALAYTT